jgi:hypothetical protein
MSLGSVAELTLGSDIKNSKLDKQFFFIEILGNPEIYYN